VPAISITNYNRPIGDYLAEIHHNKLTRVAIRKLGIIDLHSHSRLKPMLHYFNTALPEMAEASILEVGCGNGVNLFEIHRRRHVRAVGYDMDANAIEEARKVSERCFNSAIDFYCQDVFLIEDKGSYDYILCMDILEHVHAPTQLLLDLDRYLKVNGCVIISVPTEKYPLLFGEKFHRRIGHVMNGYSLAQLGSTMPQRYELVHSVYSTGLFISLGCALYYRIALSIRNRYVRLALCIMIIAIFKKLDFINNDRVSCSLFAVYRKTGSDD
jgi:2-polyprenyl-3-methyl-5-hydroxy-6-metoxy-1,4-benzoquinol methylase